MTSFNENGLKIVEEKFLQTLEIFKQNRTQQEQEMNYLRQTCETLKDENCSLKKELKRAQDDINQLMTKNETLSCESQKLKESLKNFLSGFLD